MDWIKCEDRLPEGEGFVRVFVARDLGGAGLVTSEHLFNTKTKKFQDLRFVEVLYVTHWQHTPPPPKED